MKTAMRAKIWLPLTGVVAALLCWLLGCKVLGRNELGRDEQIHEGGDPAASIAPPPASAQSPLLRLGQTAELAVYRIKLVSQRNCGTNTSARPRSGNRTWAAELEVTNTSSEPIPTNPFYATLEDDQHFKYTTSLTGCSPILPAKLLDPGETIRGYVPYDLPVTTPSVRLSYHPVLRGNASQVARFEIEL